MFERRPSDSRIDLSGITMSGAGGGGWKNVSAPSASFSWLPFTVQQSGRSFRPDPSFDIQTRAGISVTTTYYVDANVVGGDGSGSSWANAISVLSTALTKVDVDRIYVAKGYYYRNRSWSGTSPTRSIEVIGDLTQGTGDGVYITANCDNQVGAWAASSAHYIATDGGRTIESIWDNGNQDAHGHAQLMTLVANEAAVDATANTWWKSAGNVYIHLTGERVPDTDVWTMESGGVCKLLRDSRTLYVENLIFQGGRMPVQIESATATGSTKFYAKNCEVGYASREAVAQNNLSISGVDEVILQNCNVYKSSLADGINYKELNGIAGNCVEIDIHSWNNGNGSTDQASSGHGGVSIVRLGSDQLNGKGEYAYQVGKGIADVDACQVWCLGIYAHNSTSNDNFWIEDAGGNMWLDSCTGDASGNYDITAGSDALAFYRDFLPAGFTTFGTVVSY